MPDDHATSPPTRRRLFVIALATALLLGAAPAPARAAAPPAPVACPVAITISATSWVNGFQATFGLRNITYTTIPAGWVLTFRLTSGAVIRFAFGTNEWSQVGSLIIIIGPPWAIIAPGSQVWFGVNGTGTFGVSSVTFNGIPCSPV